MTNCTVYRNIARMASGTVTVLNGDLRFANNTMTENAGYGLVVTADPISSGVAPNCEIVNSILWRNGGTEIQVGGLDSQNRPPKVSVDYCDILAGWPGTGNLSVDPKLVNALTGNHRLAWGSPCLDAGTTTPTWLPATDFEGDPRVAVAGIDIGADEMIPTRRLLASDVADLSLSQGGTPTFSFVGKSGEIFVLLSTLSGPVPGLDLGLHHLPLNVDDATLLLLVGFPGSVGVMPGTTAAVKMPFRGSLPGSFDGLRLGWAVLYMDASGWSGCSNPESLWFVK
jgi:hypothetical protein